MTSDLSTRAGDAVEATAAFPRAAWPAALWRLLEGDEPAALDGDAAGGRWRRAALAAYALHLFTVFALALSNILLGLTLALAPRALAARRVRWAALAPMLLPMGFYLTFLTASIVLSYEPRTSLLAFGELFAMATLYLGPGLVRGERTLRRLIDGMIAVAALIALRGLSQYLRVGFGELEGRIRGPFSHYMTLSGVLLICDVLLVAQMVCGRAARSAWRWAALALINVALVGTMTRGAWLALGGTLVCLLALHARRRPAGDTQPRHPGRRYAAILALSLLAALLLAPASVLHRAVSIFDLRDASNYDRLCMIDAGLHMIADRPLVGLGPDMVDHRYEIYRHASAPRYSVPHLHDSFLEIAAERGLPSLAAYLWLTIASVRLSLRRYRREGGLGGPRADIYLGSMLALLAFNLAGLFENNWGDAEVKRLALFALMMPFCLELADTELLPAAEPAHGSNGGGPAAATGRALRVLFLCTHNSARSQMAEGILRSWRPAYEVASAGTEVTRVHPLAVRAMAEHGIDISRQRSKHLSEFTGQRFDYVITVCDRARESCPIFPGDPEQVHWSIPDPSAAAGSERARQRAFDAAARDLITRLRYFLALLERPQA